MNLLITRTSLEGIFKPSLNLNLPYEDLLHDICVDFYLMRSGAKTVTPLVDRLVQINNVENYTTVHTALWNLIYNKFGDKWNRIYEALVVNKYDPSANYELNRDRSGVNTDKLDYNSTFRNDGKTGTKLETTNNYKDDSNIYGFNSQEAVGDSTANGDNTETVIGEAEDNTTENTNTRSGNDTHTITFGEGLNTTGRDKTVAENLNQELDMRDKRIFFDIVLKDIDSVMVLQIYERGVI